MIPPFANDPKKVQWRNEAIIKSIDELFCGKLPASKQYWSMSSECAINGHLKENSEADQLYKSGFITPDQFFGVEKKLQLHQNNVGAPGNWIHGDFFTVIRGYASKGNFNPGVVDVDMMWHPKKAATYFADVFCFLSELNLQNVILIGNFVLRDAHNKSPQNGEDIIDELNKHKKITYNVNKWILPDIYYEYKGVGKRTTTIMGSITFVRKK